MINMSLATAIHQAKFDAHPSDHAGHIRQIETMHDLFAGRYDSVTTVGETFDGAVVGLGVAEAVDGEIVHVDGTTWHIPADGMPRVAPAELGMPFAVAAYGGSAVTREIPEGAGFSDITALVDDVLAVESQHHDYLVAAVKVVGDFSHVLLRSEHGQTPPYQPLGSPGSVTGEVRFEFAPWHGTLAGFRFPDVADDVVIPGLHLHGISRDHASGGHCHEFTITRGRLYVWVDDVEVEVPGLPVAA
jgi:acetolactate decarboxylase